MSMGNSSKQALDATILDRLYKVIESRRGADPEKSNTTRSPRSWAKRRWRP